MNVALIVSLGIASFGFALTEGEPPEPLRSGSAASTANESRRPAPPPDKRESGGNAGGQTGSPFAAPGGYAAVEIAKHSIRDEKRGKDLSVRIHHPKGPGPFPVIVFSHGFGAGKTAFTPITEHWASHGFVVISPDHADANKLGGRARGGDEADPPRSPTPSDKPAPGSTRQAPNRRRTVRPTMPNGAPMPQLSTSAVGVRSDETNPGPRGVGSGSDDAGKQPPEAGPGKTGPGGDERRRWLRDRLSGVGGGGSLGGFAMGSAAGLEERAADIRAIIDALETIERQVPALRGAIDRTRIAVAGHSYGAATAMVIGGVRPGNGKESSDLADPRVRCVLPISAAGAGEYGFTAESFRSLRVPALFITGTRDIRPGKTFEWRREPFEGAPAGDKHLLILEGANHMQFGGGLARGGMRNRPGADGAGGLQHPGQRSADRFTALVKEATTIFLAAHLRGEAEARKDLSAEGFGKRAAPVGSLESK
jgi:predicted dienelactone hydrolase